MKRPEARRKLSEARKGENNPMYGRTGENHPNYGKPRSEETGKCRKTTRQNSPNTSRNADALNIIPLVSFSFHFPLTWNSEKRRLMFQKFAGVPGGTLYRWVHKWTKDV